MNKDFLCETRKWDGQEANEQQTETESFHNFPRHPISFAQIRNPTTESRDKSEFHKFTFSNSLTLLFASFEIWSFDIVSDFVLRIQDAAPWFEV